MEITSTAWFGLSVGSLWEVEMIEPTEADIYQEAIQEGRLIPDRKYNFHDGEEGYEKPRSYRFPSRVPLPVPINHNTKG